MENHENHENPGFHGFSAFWTFPEILPCQVSENPALSAVSECFSPAERDQDLRWQRLGALRVELRRFATHMRTHDTSCHAIKYWDHRKTQHFHGFRKIQVLGSWVIFEVVYK